MKKIIGSYDCDYCVGNLIYMKIYLLSDKSITVDYLDNNKLCNIKYNTYIDFENDTKISLKYTELMDDIFNLDGYYVEKTEDGFNIWLKKQSMYYNVAIIDPDNVWEGFDEDYNSSVSYDAVDIIDELESDLVDMPNHILNALLAESDNDKVLTILNSLF